MKKQKKYRLRLPESQMSEAFVNSACLALSGGFQDAYTYNVREHVFSNAQTGNVVLMSQHIMAGEWQTAIRYLLPLLAFALGVMIAEQIQYFFKYSKKIHWRQGILLIEIGILFIVGFLPVKLNMAATILVSFACALQVQSFRKVEGYSYASTMCIGNLRSGMDSLSVYIRERRPEQLKRCFYYFGIIFLFAVGAGIGGNCSKKYGICTIWISCGLLLISFLVMHLERLKWSET